MRYINMAGLFTCINTVYDFWVINCHFKQYRINSIFVITVFEITKKLVDHIFWNITQTNEIVPIITYNRYKYIRLSISQITHTIYFKLPVVIVIYLRVHLKKVFFLNANTTLVQRVNMNECANLNVNNAATIVLFISELTSSRKLVM